ncbi:oxidoreductase [Streptosporangium carneum]|uniref:Short-chain dehydrogenase n=1 Tax=Streptosporangium carneum TaxID=47481 RepID=A0A9W6MCI3_9ACTN|nr:oxidoreductase [Streptosporangium carneum]GLK08773.1 short-chain dehydrogenase [Streptosporangium carneum]
MWTLDDIPDLTGFTALVTGANSGIGLPTALHLARRGARVVMTAREQTRGQGALDAIRTAVPGGEVELRLLDLADLGSVRAFADGFDEPLDLLVNNAGIGMISRQTTADGFEMQFGTNHLGHFALTGLLLPHLLARPGARVVTVSSDAHSLGRIDFDNLGLERGYGRVSAYSRSKLANLLFTLELQRRARGRLLGLATHPGATATGIMGKGWVARPVGALMRLLLQPAEKGAIPSLYAATSPHATGGLFVGPGPKALTPSARARDESLARRLWETSEDLTGVRFKVIT